MACSSRRSPSPSRAGRSRASARRASWRRTLTCGAIPRRLLLPGTLNAHNHSFQSMLRGIADDCDFFTWRDNALYAYSPHMDEEAVYHGARFAFAEMMRNGVTTVCDFFYIHRGGNENDHAVIRAARDLGMRIVLAPHDVRLGRRADASIRRRLTTAVGAHARAMAGVSWARRRACAARATLAARRQPGDDPGRIEARRGTGHALPHARRRGTLRARHHPREVWPDADSLAGVARPGAGAADDHPRLLAGG